MLKNAHLKDVDIDDIGDRRFNDVQYNFCKGQSLPILSYERNESPQALH